MKIAILDDYQNVALRMADWSALSWRAEITVFNDHVADPSALVDRLLPYDVVRVTLRLIWKRRRSSKKPVVRGLNFR